MLKLLLLRILLLNTSFDGGKRLPRKWPESTALFFTGSFRTFRHSWAGRAGRRCCSAVQPERVCWHRKSNGVNDVEGSADEKVLAGQDQRRGGGREEAEFASCRKEDFTCGLGCLGHTRGRFSRVQLDFMRNYSSRHLPRVATAPCLRIQGARRSSFSNHYSETHTNKKNQSIKKPPIDNVSKVQPN